MLNDYSELDASISFGRTLHMMKAVRIQLPYLITLMSAYDAMPAAPAPLAVPPPYLVLPLASPFDWKALDRFTVVDMPVGVPLHSTNLSPSALAESLLAHDMIPWLLKLGPRPMAAAVGAAMAASRHLEQLAERIEKEGSQLVPPWMSTYLLFRSSVLVVGSPLRVVHPQEDGAVIFGDQLSLQLEFFLVASSSPSPTGGSQRAPAFDFRPLVVRGGLQLCVYLKYGAPSAIDPSSRALPSWCDDNSDKGAQTCGPVSEMLEVHWDGLLPGTYVATAWVEFNLAQSPLSDIAEWTDIGKPMGDNPNPWVLQPVARTFRIAHHAASQGKPHEEPTEENDSPVKEGLDTTIHDDDDDDHPGMTSVRCHAFPDDSEWCHYGGGGVCLDLESNELRLLRNNSRSSTGCRESHGCLGEISRRRDEDRFVPAGHEKSQEKFDFVHTEDNPIKEGERMVESRGHDNSSDGSADGSPSTSPWALPLRSAARASWMDTPSSDLRLDDDGLLAGAVWARDTIGAFAFIDCPHNIVHQSAKVFQLSHVLSELAKTKPSRPSKTAVLPLTCGRGPLGLGDYKPCRTALDVTKERAGTSDWFVGITSVLFHDHLPQNLNRTNSTQSDSTNERRTTERRTNVIHDPKDFAKSLTPTRTPTTTGPKEAPRYLCFPEAVVAGESRALFRGPADARRFRSRAQRMLLTRRVEETVNSTKTTPSSGASSEEGKDEAVTANASPVPGISAGRKAASRPVSMLRQRPPRSIVVVQRPSNNRPIANLEALLLVLRQSLDISACLDGNVEGGNEGEDGSPDLGNQTLKDYSADGEDGKTGPVTTSFISANGVRVSVVVLENLSFAEQATIFSECGICILVQGAAMANLVFLPEGAAVIELKQVRDIAAAAHLHHFAVRALRPPTEAILKAHTDSSSATREGVAAAEEGVGQEEVTRAHFSCALLPGVRLPPSHTSGAPMSFCPSMSFNSKWPVHVPASPDLLVDTTDRSPDRQQHKELQQGSHLGNLLERLKCGGLVDGGLFGVAVADALVVTGIVSLACEECGEASGDNNSSSGSGTRTKTEETGVNWWKQVHGGNR